MAKMWDKGYEFKPSKNVNNSYGAFHDRFTNNGKTYKLEN